SSSFDSSISRPAAGNQTAADECCRSADPPGRLRPLAVLPQRLRRVGWDAAVRRIDDERRAVRRLELDAAVVPEVVVRARDIRFAPPVPLVTGAKDGLGRLLFELGNFVGTQLRFSGERGGALGRRQGLIGPDPLRVRLAPRRLRRRCGARVLPGSLSCLGSGRRCDERGGDGSEERTGSEGPAHKYLLKTSARR